MGFMHLKPQTHSTVITYAIVIVAFIVVTLLDGMGLISNSLSGQLVPICAYVSLAVSLNLVVGVSGELSLGHAGFMSVGAFTGVIVAGCLARMVRAFALRGVCRRRCRRCGHHRLFGGHPGHAPAR